MLRSEPSPPGAAVKRALVPCHLVFAQRNAQPRRARVSKHAKGVRDDEETPDGRGSRGPPVAAVLRFRPAQVYLGADAGGATFKLVRSGLAWGPLAALTKPTYHVACS